MQDIITYIIGILACLYLLYVFLKQFNHKEYNQKCTKCPENKEHSEL